MQADLILAGGGLANSLIAYRLRMVRPDLRILLIDRESGLGGNHTWSFHASDLTPDQNLWLAPLIVHAWPGYQVRFPGRSRRVGLGYRSVTAERLNRVVAAALDGCCRMGAEISAITPTTVELGGVQTLTAGAVIDGRGVRASPALALRFQKFLGQEWRTETPHGLTEPIVMDATVAQTDGYRFLYVLPFAPDRLLIEDTFYSDDAGLAQDQCRAEIAAYAQRQGWWLAQLVREETGVLPVALGGDLVRFWAEGGAGLPRSGLAAALFHPTTGYSLPEAVRLADRIALAPDLSAPALYRLTRDQSLRRWSRQGFFRLLNRMLFLAARPDQRWRVLERFYGLSEPLIARFYAGAPTAGDMLRLLAGKPPVPVASALGCLFRADRRQSFPERAE